MNKDGVATAFELIVGEIESVAAELAEQGAKALREKDYSGAQQVIESGKSLEEFRAKVDALLDEWQSGIDIMTRQRFITARHQELFAVNPKRPKPQALRQHHSKNSKTGLRVTFPDGETIAEYIAADTFALVLRKLGLARVEALGCAELNMPLVGDARSSDYGQRRVDGRYVLTHFSNQKKKEILERVAKRLGTTIKVQVTDRNG